MPYRVPTALDLSEAERTELENWSRRRKTAQALALRARIVLQAAAGLTNTAIAAELGVAKHTVGKWRERFARQRTDGLLDGWKHCFQPSGRAATDQGPANRGVGGPHACGAAGEQHALEPADDGQGHWSVGHDRGPGLAGLWPAAAPDGDLRAVH